jgi:hypothetical protein
MKRAAARRRRALGGAVFLLASSGVAAALLVSASPVPASTDSACFGTSCVGLDPQGSGCSADADTKIANTYSAPDLHARWHIQLRYSANCGAGWLRLWTDVGALPGTAYALSTWNPGGVSSRNTAGTHYLGTVWTTMVNATGDQVCGGSQQYLNGRWKHWWFYGCYTSATLAPNGGEPPTTQDTPPPTTQDTPPPTTEDAPTTYTETETYRHLVNTFLNYHNASGMGLPIAAGQSVEVSCKVYDPYIASVNPDGYWYRIASSPWNNQYYSPANTFLDGDPPGGPYTHNTDFSVPDC